MLKKEYDQVEKGLKEVKRRMGNNSDELMKGRIEKNASKKIQDRSDQYRKYSKKLEEVQVKLRLTDFLVEEMRIKEMEGSLEDKKK